VFIGLVARLGLLERSDTAWDHSEYTQVEEGMRTEFELDDRFKNLEFKLNLIQVSLPRQKTRLAIQEKLLSAVMSDLRVPRASEQFARN